MNALLKLPNVDVYVTGSNSTMLSKDVMTEFRGRGDEVRVRPLSFLEFMSVYEGDVVDVLASGVGSLTNPQKLANTFMN